MKFKSLVKAASFAIATTGLVIGAGALSAQAQPRGVSSTQAELGSCWLETNYNNGTVSERKYCVKGSTDDLATAVYNKFGVVIVGSPDESVASSRAGQARLKAVTERSRTTSLTSSSINGGEPTVTATATPGPSSNATAASYVLGVVYKNTGYGGYTYTFTSSQSSPCQSYLFSYPNLDFSWNGGVAKVNDDIEGMKPGPGCKMKYWVDNGYSGSTYPASGYATANHSTLDYMDNLASSMKISG